MMYTDLDVMFADIVEHTKETGDTILPADDPGQPNWPPPGWARPPTLGFIATNVTTDVVKNWEITLWDVKASMARKNVDAKTQALREALKTREGKIKLCMSLEGAGRAQREVEAGA